MCKAFISRVPLHYSGGWGLAAAGNTEITEVDRAAITRESSWRKGESPSITARYGQRPRSSLHQQLCGPRNPQSLQWSSVCVLLHLLIFKILNNLHLFIFYFFFVFFFLFVILCFYLFLRETFKGIINTSEKKHDWTQQKIIKFYFGIFYIKTNTLQKIMLLFNITFEKYYNKYKLLQYHYYY